jgi:hypothetical protein
VPIVSASNHRGWYGYSERLSCLEIDAEVETRRLLEWQVGRLGSLQNAIDQIGRSIVNLIYVEEASAAKSLPIRSRRAAVVVPGAKHETGR